MNSILTKIIDIKGTAGRREYLLFTLINTILIAVISQIVRNYLPIIAIQYVVAILFFLLQMPITIKRLNDLNLNRLLVILLIIPYANGLFCLYLALKKGPVQKNDFNKNDHEPEIIVNCPECNSDDVSSNESALRIRMENDASTFCFLQKGNTKMAQDTILHDLSFSRFEM